jgi:hypothetical protein
LLSEIAANAKKFLPWRHIVRRDALAYWVAEILNGLALAAEKAAKQFVKALCAAPRGGSKL